MARPRRIDPLVVKRAQLTATVTTSVQSLRQCQAVLLPALFGATLEQTAAVLGVGRATVPRLQAAFRKHQSALPNPARNWGVKDNAAGQAWYDSLLAQYAGWGVDLIKVDCIAAHPYKADEIRMIRKAIDQAGRPMVLSLSPGPTALANADEVAQLANMWRISDDFWDVWTSDPGKAFPQSLTGQFAKVAAWAPYTKPGHWPDADMLPLGHLGPVPGWGQPRDTRFTAAEQQTLLTLWSMARSPLILGANLDRKSVVQGK